MMGRDSAWVSIATFALGLSVASCSSNPQPSSGKGKTGSTTGQDGGQAGSGSNGTGGSGAGAGQGGKKDGGAGGSGTGGSGTGGNGTGGNGTGGTAGGNKDGGGGDGSTSACKKTGNDDNCDGKDDDCDGTIDESYVGTATTCGEGVCKATGVTSCANGSVVDSCTPGDKLAATDTTCDGVDDDCDGTKDDDYVPDASCGTGACQTGNTPSHCNNAVETPCQPGSPASDDSVCNDVDDDCDGHTDEEFSGGTSHCGVGACSGNTGTRTCVSGVAHDTCDPLAGAATDDATCDGIDDDCDSHADEEYASTLTACGTGYCVAAGTTSCVGGHVQDSCMPGTKLAATDTTCDGVDDDCDGTKDDEYAPVGTSCGVGYCASTGSTSCVDGNVQNSCAPRTKLAATDTTCDGVDDDCDGSKDEEYVSLPTTCGVGTCASTGSTSCVNGNAVDSCVPTTGFTTDTTCNGFDDDCDGHTDEEYAPVTACGTGACRTSSTPSSCSNGVETACQPGAQISPTDTTCDGIDDNCSGAADEGYVSLPTSCGVGACAATGLTSCSGGHVADSCRAGTAATSDATCDGKDDDCDGHTDEEYIGCFDGGTIGGCQGGHVVGTFSCNDGFSCTTDSCVPATGSCDFAPANAACPNDGYSCTHELCVANTDPGTNQTTGCARVAIDADCPDAKFCNGSEVCDPARTSGSFGSTGCAASLPVNVPCDPNVDIDSVPCTDTVCVEDGLASDGKPKGHCASTPDASFCTDIDGHYCNGVETCAPGPSADANGCVAGTYPCAAAPACALSSCTNTGVNTGTCSVLPNPAYSCTDGQPCTTDACDTGAAANTTGCTHTLITPCDGCVAAADCDDGHTCTVDSCQSPMCMHDRTGCQCLTDAECNDGKACTGDACNANGQCVHTANDSYCINQDLGQGGLCNGGDLCDPTNGGANAQGCVHLNAPLNCNDGLSCTADSCDPTSGCQHTPDNRQCAISDAVKCDGTATCDPSASPGSTGGTGCVNPVGSVACPDDGIACTSEVCVEDPSPSPGLTPSSFHCAEQPSDAYCLAQPSGCGSHCQIGVGCVKTCNIATCQGKTYQCGDCIDNDGDCRIDTGADPDCLGPCSNNEAGFHGDIPGQNNSPCKADCYFDQDTGAGNDGCYWDHSCDPLEVAPNYPPEDSKCKYDPNTHIAGTNKSCAQLMSTNPPGQSTTCWQAGVLPTGNSGPNYCGILVPNGCDCFGCCAIQGVGYPVYLGSEDGSGNGSCSLSTLTDKTKCKPCTQVPSCLNTCEHCELCVGKTTLPDDCACQVCPANQQKCGAPCGTPCPDNFFCNTGCCAPVPQ